MAEEKKVAAATEKAAPAPKKAPKAKVEKVDEKKAAPAKVFAKAIKHDYDVILEPLITEKTMALLQNANKVTVKVAPKTNKTEIKESFQRLYQAEVVDVKILNQIAKAKTRGGRYQGMVGGFKKAIVTIAKGSAVDLFKA